MQATLDTIKALLTEEKQVSFNDGLLLGIAALKRAKVHLETRSQLNEHEQAKRTDAVLAEWMNRDIMGLTSKLK